MIVKVRMLAFGKPDQVRQVIIPDDTEADGILNAVFYYGQNDFQPQKGVPSVSVGDVIEHDEKLFMVCRSGFRELTTEQLNEYETLDRRSRNFCKLVDPVS